ncbi:serine hydrolase [Gramella sp. KN1008]|uniref:serine hydrolase domain-containing protein n=1 Tax=Gramella sp. KN1008 TaxID=2529298 RepID=UPI00103E59EA|nr:serine hydrolase domain-containing protein [Gramella sp. KN1008]TBW25907.1 class A beta-lactamase-related serine hydrolase [Gramella sp. KN1008]
MYRFYCIFLLFLINACKDTPETSTASGKNSLDSVDPIIENYESRLDSLIPMLQVEFNVPAVAVGIIKNNELVLDTVYGEHQLGTEAPKNAIFNVASITKPVFTAGVLKLVKDGSWDLDEPVSQYWEDPDLENDSLAELITSRHLLTHSAGFNTNWRWQNEDGKLQLNNTPGRKFSYSGEGFEYLKIAIEKRYDKDMGALMDSILFEPLGMKDATFHWIPEEDFSRFAKWYDGEGNEYETKYKTPHANAADDLLISLQDMSKLLIALMNKDFLGEELTNEMFKTQLDKNSNSAMGLGWHMVPNGFYKEEKALFHSGSDSGTQAMTLFFPNSKSGLIIFTNGDNGLLIYNQVIKNLIMNGNRLIQLMNWSSKPPEVKAVEESLLDNYSGSYRTNLDRIMTVKKVDSTLLIGGEGIPGLELYAMSDHKFFPEDYERIFEFKENEEGAMSFKLYDEADNVILSGVKEEN